MDMEKQSFSLMKRPNKGEIGKPINALVNYFTFSKHILNREVFEYEVRIFKIDERRPKGKSQQGVQPVEKDITNKTLRSSIFWDLVEFEKLRFYAFDDWNTAFSSKDYTDYIQLTKVIEAPPNMRNKCESRFRVQMKKINQYKINLIHQDPGIAQRSELALKCFITQGVRYPYNKNSTNFCYYNGSIYPIPRTEADGWKVKIFDNIEAWLGLYAGVRTIENFDTVVSFRITHKLFEMMNIDLVTFFVEVLNTIDEREKDWRCKIPNMTIKPLERSRFTEAVKGCRVKAFKEFGALMFDKERRPFLAERHFKVDDIIEETANNFFVHGKCIAEWYYILYKELKYPNLQLAKVKYGKTGVSYIPLEVLFTYDTPERYRKNFPYFFSKQQYIRKVSHKPSEYARLLHDTIDKINESSKFMETDSPQIVPELMKVTGRILPPPKLRDTNGRILDIYADGRYRSLALNECPQLPVEFSVLIHYFQKGSRSNLASVSNDDARIFFNSLIACLKERGLTLNDDLPQVYKTFKPNIPAERGKYGEFCDIETAVENQIHSWCNRYGPEFRSKISPIFLIFISNVADENIYGFIKLLLDNKYGIVSQVVERTVVSQALKTITESKSIFYNIALKINSKLGGLNITADLPKIQDLEPDKPNEIMYIGIDVTHPPPIDSNATTDTQNMDISLAAMVGSIDSSGTRYVYEPYAQMQMKEQVECFDNQFQRLMFKFHDVNKCFPKHIVIYRDGVSNSQLLETASTELHWIKKSWKQIQRGYDEIEMPMFTYIVVQKRHQTRYFMPSKSNGELVNIPFGSVFDSNVVSPVLFDFWLCAHQAKENSTARPIHYIVAYDDRNLTSDEIYEMTYRLCFLNARCRGAISLPSPIHYANLVCLKLKDKYKALMRNEEVFPNLIEQKALIEDHLKRHDEYPGMCFT